MWWVALLVVLAVVTVVVMRRSGPSPTPVSRPAAPTAVDTDTERQLLRRVEADAERLMPQIEDDAARIIAEAEANAAAEFERSQPDDDASARPLKNNSAEAGPSWMAADDWQRRVEAYRQQGKGDQQIAETAAYLERRGPRVPRHREGQVSGAMSTGGVSRSDFAPKEVEARYLTRDGSGLPSLRLVEAGDRLAIWSPVEGGAFINPKGPGLRSLGLCSSYARGSKYYESAFRAADLRPGRWIELRREPDNPHGETAVAMHAPGARALFAYVQRGRSRTVSLRMDAGEDMAAVSMRGPGRGHDDDVAFVLIGSRADLTAMLHG